MREKNLNHSHKHTNTPYCWIHHSGVSKIKKNWCQSIKTLNFKLVIPIFSYALRFLSNQTDNISHEFSLLLQAKSDFSRESGP